MKISRKSSKFKGKYLDLKILKMFLSAKGFSLPDNKLEIDEFILGFEHALKD